MEVVLTSVPIHMEATCVHADVAMNSRGKMEPLEVELVVVWSQTKTLMLEDSVKVDYYFVSSVPSILVSKLIYQKKLTSTYPKAATLLNL